MKVMKRKNERKEDQVLGWFLSIPLFEAVVVVLVPMMHSKGIKVESHSNLYYVLMVDNGHSLASQTQQFDVNINQIQYITPRWPIPLSLRIPEIVKKMSKSNLDRENLHFLSSWMVG